MKIVQSLKTDDWTALKAIVSTWAEQEQQTTEALFYRAVTEYS